MHTYRSGAQFKKWLAGINRQQKPEGTHDDLSPDPNEQIISDTYRNATTLRNIMAVYLQRKIDGGYII